MHIVLHGGMHKTGTTTLQQFLAEHRAELLQTGFCYPGEDTHHGFAFNFRQIPGLSADCVALVEAAELAGAHTLVLSGEVISTLREDQYNRLRQSLAGHELHFVFCFRHWTSYLPSRWAQYCSRRDSMTLDEYLVATGPHCNFVDRRFDLVLERALAHGRVTAVSYDNAMASDSSALPATLRAIGLPEALVEQGASFTTRHNARSNWEFTEVVRLLNGAIAKRRGLPGDELFATLAQSRPFCILFDYAHPISQLPEVLQNQMQKIVHAHRVTRIIGSEGTLAIETRLNEHYGSLFTNRVDGRIFPTDLSVRTATCDLTAERFQSLYSEIANVALAALEHLWLPLP